MAWWLVLLYLIGFFLLVSLVTVGILLWVFEKRKNYDNIRDSLPSMSSKAES